MADQIKELRERNAAGWAIAKARLEVIERLQAQVAELEGKIEDRQELRSLYAATAQLLHRDHAFVQREWERNERLEGLLRVLLENNPNDAAADGVTVLDAWRTEVRAALEPQNRKAAS